MNDSIGVALDFIDGGRPRCRLEECPFGDFLTDAMATEMKVDIAFINSGAIKGSFQKGFLFCFVISLTRCWNKK